MLGHTLLLLHALGCILLPWYALGHTLLWGEAGGQKPLPRNAGGHVLRGADIQLLIHEDERVDASHCEHCTQGSLSTELLGCVVGSSYLRGMLSSYIKGQLPLGLTGHITTLFSSGKLGKSALC